MVKKTEKGVKKGVVNKGAWTAEEDQKLVDYVRAHGDKKWRTLPVKAGLSRCGKSCRLRWLNYLRPGIKRGNISEDEEDLIIRLHNLLGNRWSLIAGRLPGRTDNEIKNHWNTHLSKKSLTINDLNTKLSGKVEEQSNSLHDSVVDPESDSSFPPIPDSTENALIGNSGAELSNSEIDMDELFNFLDVPEFDFGSGGHTELAAEDYGVIGQGSYQDLLETRIYGSDGQDGLDPQVMHNQLDFDDLGRFIDYVMFLP